MAIEIRREVTDKPGQPDTMKDRPPITYFCKACGRKEQGERAPKGWYILSQARGVPRIKNTFIGYACSPSCLLQLANEIDYSARWQEQRTHTRPAVAEESKR